MKINYRIAICTFIASILGFIISCRKDVGSPSTKSAAEALAQYMEDEGASEENDFNYVAVTYNQINNPFASRNDITLSANFSDGNSTVAENAGTLTFYNQSLEPDMDNGYFKRLINSDSLSVTQNFSNDVQFGFSGSPVINALITPPVRMPGKIYPGSISLPSTVLPKSQDLNLTWSVDNSTIDHNMRIQVSYYKRISQDYVPTAPNEIASIFYIVPDNGSYRITVADLSRFPIGTYVGVSLARGYATSSTIIKRGVVQNLYSLAVVRSATIPLLIIE